MPANEEDPEGQFVVMKDHEHGRNILLNKEEVQKFQEGSSTEGAQEMTGSEQKENAQPSFEAIGKARVEQGMQSIKAAGQRIGGFFEKAKSKVGNFFKKAGQVGLKTVYNIAAAPEYVDSGMKKIDQGLSYAGEKISEGAEAVYDKGVEIKDQVVNDAKEVWDDMVFLKQQAEEAVINAKNTAIEWKNRKVEQVTEIKDVTVVVAQLVGEAIKEGTIEAYDTAAAKVREGYNKVREFGAEKIALAKMEMLKTKVSFFTKMNTFKMKIFERLAARNERKAQRWEARRQNMMAKNDLLTSLIEPRAPQGAMA